MGDPFSCPLAIGVAYGGCVLRWSQLSHVFRLLTELQLDGGILFD
jgi:hypothetical protein